MGEWKTIRISDLGKIVTGKTPKTSIPQNYGGTIPFLTPSDNLDYKTVLNTAKTLSESGVAEVKNCLLPANSICVSCIGSDLGKVVMTNRETITNQQFNSIIPNQKYCPDFIYYLMIIVGKELNFLSKTSTAIPIINKTTFSNFEVYVPDDLSTQRRIAGILGSLDDKIELNRRINANLEAQAQALFRSWFVDFEPFRDGPFVDSELGKIPQGWKVAELGDVTKQQTEKVGPQKTVKVLSPITTGELVLSEEYFTKQVFSESIAKYIIVKPDQFAYNPARINIGSIGRNTFEFDGCVSPVYVVFECEKGYHYFFDFFRKTDAFKQEVISRAIGGVRQTLGYKDFALIKVIYPPQNVVLEFNRIYTNLLNLQNHNILEIKTLSALRDTLLPKLMAGEIKI